MCEILVILQNPRTTPADPVKALRGPYGRGDFVVCMDDGHLWGSSERPPLFGVIKIPGVSRARGRVLCEHDADEIDETITDPVTGQPLRRVYQRVIRRRLRRLRVDDLPVGARNLLESGWLTIKVGTYNGPHDYTWAQVRNFIRNRRDGTDGVDL